MLPETNTGRWGSHAMSARQDGPPTGRPAAVTEPPDSGSRPATAPSSVDLPQPDGPRSTVTPVPSSTASRWATAGRVRPSYPTLTSASTSGLPAAAVASTPASGAYVVSASTASKVATPSAAAWNSAPTRRSGQ